MKGTDFVSIEDALKEGVDVVALFNGSIGVRNGFVRDVGLDASVKVEDYHIPRVVLDVLREGGDNVYNDIILTRIEKSFHPLEKWKIKRVLKSWDDNRKFACGTYGRKTCDRCKTEYVVKHPCKAEWCPYCGEPGSLFHIERYVETLFYAFQMWLNAGSVGGLVVTSPLEVREQWKNKKALSDVASTVRKILQDEGFLYGRWQWHFAGDKGVFYPHLNVLIPWGYMAEEKLQRIKEVIKLKLGVRDIHYQYARDLERVKHMVYYITRPTWRLQSELDPSEWKHFRKSNIWGPKYFSKDEEMWNLFYQVMFKKGQVKDGESFENAGEFEIGDDLSFLLSLERNKCPFCGGKLVGGYFRGYNDKWIKGGVYRLGWNLWLILLKKQKRKKREVEYGEHR
ncbi:MAG: hypothetical protein ACO2OT_02770 [Candidatus Caldipriscus sp.]